MQSVEHPECFSSFRFLFQVSAKVAGSSVAQPPRFEIKKWNAVAMWSWDICADTVRPRLLQSICVIPLHHYSHRPLNITSVLFVEIR